MKARVMISSVVKDQMPLGDVSCLKAFWHQGGTIYERLKKANHSAGRETEIGFSFVRAEILQHIQGKYALDVYEFERTPGPGRAPYEETISEAAKSHLVIGVFGSKTGWKVPDQDPLTPTLREWRVALLTPLKFKVFLLKSSIEIQRLPGELGKVMREISDYKKGKMYSEFTDMADLFAKLDVVIQDHLNRAIVRYASDIIVKEPTSETEDWLLSPYRARQKKMLQVFERVAELLGIGKGTLTLGDHDQPVSLHCVPDNFSIPESRKFAAYVFDDEARGHKPKDTGKLHFIAVFGGVTDLQVRRHLGNLEAAKVYSASWGFFASEPGRGIQCVYLPRCNNYLRMQSSMSNAITWLVKHGKEVGELAKLRGEILDVIRE